MYVIGTVESNCDWSACNYVDAVTVGMMQWYGSRARNLLERGRTADPDGWNTFASAAPTLSQQVQLNDIDWTARYLSAVEGNAWKTWAQRDENHAFQEVQWEADWDGYQSTMTNFGFPDGNVKERIMWACAYHQSPAQAQRVLASCSAAATLELIYTTILADGVLGQYRNRYTTAYDLLKSWDARPRRLILVRLPNRLTRLEATSPASRGNPRVPRGYNCRVITLSTTAGALPPFS